MEEQPEVTEIQRSTRDPAELRTKLQAWLADQLPPDAGLQVGDVRIPSTNGMSSETVLFDATWTEEGESHARAFAARLAPEDTAVPVFPSYDLARQARVMQEVRAATEVPVPEVFWCEPVGEAVGTPFFVMQRVEGQVPPDVMPYPFGSWVTEATPEQRRRMQDSSIGVLAELHSIEDARGRFAFLELHRRGSTAMHRQVADQHAYYDWAREGLRVPLIERAFDWLEEHWPAHEGPTGLSWGDSRIGNVMYREFEPVAVLDWEMAGLGPPEIDLAWFVYLHRFFQDLAQDYGLEGLPDFLRPDDVWATYESMTGYTPRDLDFFTVYAAVRYAIVSVRTTQRGVHFGQAEMPEDLDDLIMHRRGVEALLAGTYW